MYDLFHDWSHRFGPPSYECPRCPLRGELVDGARMLALFGDLATELLIRPDGDEGLFRAYDNVEFLAPVYAGDYIEGHGRACNEPQNEV